MSKQDKNTTEKEPDLNLLNKAIENINSNNIKEFKFVVEKMLSDFPGGSTSWLFYAVYENLIGNINKAEEAIIKTLEINPEYGEAHRVYSDILRKDQEFMKALDHAKKAVKINNKSPAAFDTLGTAYASINDHVNAEKNFRYALKLNPNLIISMNNLGNTLRNLGKYEESLEFLKNALEKSPDTVEIYSNLALTYFELREYNDALEILKIGGTKITSSDSQNLPDIYTSYGHIFNKTNQFLKAKKYYEEAIKISNDFSSAHNGLGEVFASLRKPYKAYDSFKKSLKKAPNKSISHSNIIFCATYLCNFTNEEKLKLAIEYGENEKIEKIKLNRNNIKNKKLRVWFVSGDFYEHPVSYFLTNPLKFFNDKDFESIAFNNSKLNDSMTKELKDTFSQWIDIFHLSDEVLIKTIIDQKIDILIDLSGHTANNRLRIFKFKPAPIQLTWLGYSSTTGIKEIDYIVCDKISLPKEDEKWFVEKPLRMKKSYYCFERSSAQKIEIKKPREDVTIFGCFNNPKKISDDVINIWSKVLYSIPKSKLILKNKLYRDENLQNDIKKCFLKNKIDPFRIEFLGPSERDEYLKSYNLIDICLDPFPYPGGTTTFEALYMGKPTITLKGDSFLSRNGQNIMLNAKLDYLVANNKDEYIKKAIDLSKTIKSFDNEDIREKLLNSCLLDGKFFCDDLKYNLKEIWINQTN